MSFILNWIGFLVGFCLGSTLAAQNGALCGFGLSLIKWALVIQVGLFILQLLIDKLYHFEQWLGVRMTKSQNACT